MPDAARPGRIEFGPPPSAEVLREILACCGKDKRLETIRKISEEALKGG